MNARLVGVLKDGRLQDLHWHDVQVGDCVRVRVSMRPALGTLMCEVADCVGRA